ncbi:MAG: type III-A CRISPR-associated protein Csm2 [Bacteroidales bacterium]|nr:type III-A CRISPR-associated protein Csm2 [Bacteroidales bacterium]MCM1147749.1 type III-A CRISPR-associated protein Csm2 [Bacteroidales bacterium]MCM1206641.1 type III-A CRISPR-associated protein Csm2 [Bacillota bacterium]MCM1510618.1 type III-A CRISPR-associated protein Csm2 [Clostridium sp.]
MGYQQNTNFSKRPNDEALKEENKLRAGIEWAYKHPKSPNDEALKEENKLREKEVCIKEWIQEGATKELPDFAEEMGCAMAKYKLTNSQIRNVYCEIKRIQMGGFEKEKASFFLLRPKVAYAYGRNPGNNGLKLFKKVFEKAYNYVNDEKSYINFCNLMEAILAYHKANNGQ